jgi:hypothetical protein
MNWKGYGRKGSWHNQGIVPEFAWRDVIKPQNPVRMTSGAAAV